MVILHHNDSDGRCAAAIVEFWRKHNLKKQKESEGSNKVKFIEMDYKDDPPLEDIKRNDVIVIVDFSFKPDVFEKVKKSTDVGLIWCDHHKTCQN